MRKRQYQLCWICETVIVNDSKHKCRDIKYKKLEIIVTNDKKTKTITTNRKVKENNKNI